MKKILRAFFLILSIAACKKDNKQQPLVDFTGTWARYTVSDSAFDHSSGLLLTSAQLPCLADNLLIIRADGTAVNKYAGTITCTSTTGINIGFPGEDSTFQTWTRSGNRILIVAKAGNNLTQNSYGTIVKVNNQLQLLLRDTLTITGNSPQKKIQTGVCIKQ